MSDTQGDEMARWIREWERQQEERRKNRFAKLRDEIVPALASRGVSRVVMDYDGEGDSTNHSSLTFYGSDGEAIRDALPAEIDENEVIEILFSAVPDGYENNDGGFGQVILDVPAGTVRSEHSQRHMECTYEEAEYPL